MSADLKRAIEDFRGARRIAVVGASRDPSKYGYKVFYHLERAGYEVYAINPNCSGIGSHPCYDDFNELPESVDAAIFITPPTATLKQVGAALEHGIDLLWVQPGAADDAVLERAREAGARLVHGRCALVTI